MAADRQEDYMLVVVAHPDDETIFFTAPILQKDRPCKVLCITDGNADGQGEQRKSQFLHATKLLGVEEAIWWGAPDIYESRLTKELVWEALQSIPKPSLVYTHGPVGEYMHPHHQDICFGVHELWGESLPINGVAYNCFPQQVLHLTEAQYALKSRIVSEIYGSETKRFLNLIPCQAHETFIRTSLQEVREIYRFLTNASENLNPENLYHYRWLTSFLKHKVKEGDRRIF